MSHRTSLNWMVFILFVVLIAASNISTVPVSANHLNVAQNIEFPNTTLDICLPGEPDTLYPYGGSSFYGSMILEAVYDGPIDTVTYQSQPVILTQVPTLDNGGAMVQNLTVNNGDTVVDSFGSPVTLTPGMSVLPSGCYSMDCAVVYNGGSIQMDQFAATFDLLPGLKWSDGVSLTASDSIYSFNLDADPNTPTIKYTIERTASYQATSPTQVVWTGLPGYIDTTFADNFWTPYPQHVWGSFTPTELLTEPISSETPIGYGAYIIDQWVAGSHISMHANSNYFRATEGLPTFENVVYHFSSDLSADLRAGNCDVAPSTDLVPTTTLNSYEAMGIIQLITSPGTVFEHMDFGIQHVNYDDGWQPGDRPDFFGNVNVRKAFAYCIDRQNIADTVLFGHGTILHAYISSAHPYYPDDATEYPYDPAQGRALLEAAGWTDPDGNPTTPRIYAGSNPNIPLGTAFSVNYWTTNASQRISVAQLIADDMLNNCGVHLNQEFFVAGEFFAAGPDGPLFGRRFDLGAFAWLSGVEPPCDLYTTDQIPGLYTGWGGSNDSGYSNLLFDASCKAAQTSIIEADQEANHEEAIRIFTNDLPVLPLYLRLYTGATGLYITGFALDETESPLWNIEEIASIVETAPIPLSGGSLTSPIDQTMYTFPSNTFTDTVTITHSPVFFLQAPNGGELVSIRHTFYVTAAFENNGQAAQPSQPYIMTIQYSDAEKGAVIEDSLALYYWNGSQWIMEPTSSLDMGTNTLNATPDHFSLWAILGETNRNFLPIIAR